MELTKRDMECMESIRLYKAMTTKMLIKEVYGGSYNVGARRLRNLEQEGYIKKKRIWTGELVYYVGEEKEVYDNVEKARLLIGLKEEGNKIKSIERVGELELVELEGIEKKLILQSSLLKDIDEKEYKKEVEGLGKEETLIVFIGGLREIKKDIVYDYVVCKGIKECIEEIRGYKRR